MEALGLVLARGGSKGIPGKNLATLAGKPLIAWTIEAALQSMLNRVVVSTDSPEIRDVAVEYGAEAPFMRPKLFAGDRASPTGAEKHALSALKTLGYVPDVVMRLQPTSPFRAARDIDHALKMLEEGAQSVISITETPKHPYLFVQPGPDGHLDFNDDLHRPRQEYPHVWAINGAVYAARLPYYMEHGFYGPECVGMLMPPERALDIDTTWDLELARGVA